MSMPGELFEVVVKTKAKRRGVEVVSVGKLKVSTTEAPEKGKANADVVDILAEHFHVPKSAVEILRGKTNTKKSVRIIR